jgi:putative ABC transport system substrate-binding protein
MLLTVMPRLSRMAVLVNPTNEAHASLLTQIQDAADRAKVKLLPLRAQTPQEIDSAFSAIARQDAEAVVIGLDPLFIQQEAQIAGHALRQRLPSIFSNREYVEAGGFMSYGQNQSDIYRRAAAYVDRIFKGASPGELPIEQPTRVELAINLKTAKALGITIPQELLLRADIVIQ